MTKIITSYNMRSPEQINRLIGPAPNGPTNPGIPKLVQNLVNQIHQDRLRQAFIKDQLRRDQTNINKLLTAKKQRNNFGQ